LKNLSSANLFHSVVILITCLLQPACIFDNQTDFGEIQPSTPHQPLPQNIPSGNFANGRVFVRDHWLCSYRRLLMGRLLLHDRDNSSHGWLWRSGSTKRCRSHVYIYSHFSESWRISICTYRFLSILLRRRIQKRHQTISDEKRHHRIKRSCDLLWLGTKMGVPLFKRSIRKEFR
jgi:hypothetical protein